MFGIKSKIVTNEKQIDELLSRGVDKIYPSKEALKQILLSGRRLKLYQGFDPTGDRLHIGHMVGLRKHKQWQDMGHEVIFLVGDGTGQAGDPTGKKKTREKFFTQKELRENAKNYLTQAEKIVDFKGTNPIKILYNGDWLNKLGLVDILNIARHFSVQQLIERDMFQERMKSGEEINLREFLYPLLQGYDSVVMDVDLELGGSDQTFNMLAGRKLMKIMKGKEKFVMTMPLLADSNGLKIGKSEGNVIGLTDEPNDLFGKIMSLSDESVIPIFKLLTDVPMEEIESFDIKENPLALKKRVARLIVLQLHGEKESLEAQENFERVFSKGETPEDIVEVDVSGQTLLVDALLSQKLVESKTDFARLILDGAVTKISPQGPIKIINGKAPALPGTYKIGKRRFIKIKVV